MSVCVNVSRSVVKRLAGLSAGLGLALVLTGCGGDLPSTKTAGAIETAPRVAATATVEASSQEAANNAPAPASASAQLAADRAYADLQTALSGPPLYKNDVAPYNQGVTEAYNRWAAAEAAEFGPDWQQKYAGEQMAVREQTCRSNGAANQAQIAVCMQKAAATPAVPTLQSLLVIDDGRFHDYVDPSAAASSSAASSSSDSATV